MNKEEKKECKQQYYSTEKGKEMNIRLTRLIFIGIIGILFSCFLIVNAYNTNTSLYCFNYFYKCFNLFTN